MIIKLFETYKSQIELERLTNDMIQNIVKNTLEYHKNFVWKEQRIGSSSMKGHIYDFGTEGTYGIQDVHNNQVKFYTDTEYRDLDSLNVEWSKLNLHRFTDIKKTFLYKYTLEYNELKDFINDEKFGNIMIIPIKDRNLSKKRLGDYNERGMITLYYSDDLLSELRKAKHKLLKESDFKEVDFSDNAFQILKTHFFDTLLHELQHVYDDYRSDGKYSKHLTSDFFKNKHTADLLHSKDRLSGEEKDFINNINKQYLKFPHEINARFTQAISKIDFTKDWTSVLKSFKYNFHGWDLMSDKYKKKLIRKLSQFFHFKKEDK